MMILNMKTILILALAISFVAGHPGYMRKLQKKEDTPSKSLSLKRGVKGGDNKDADDEVDVGVKLKTCKKDSDECKELEDNENSHKVTKEEFAKKIAHDMTAALEKDDDDEDNEHGRKLDYCDVYWWCDCCYCYEYYDCYYS
jgi:hypothetical protein